MVLIIDKKRSIGDAALEIGIPEHVIRFWETQFSEYIKPTRGNGGRRYFYDKDIKTLCTIRDYLYEKGYTIAGLKKLMEQETVLVVDQEKIPSSGGENKNIINNSGSNGISNSTPENELYSINCEKIDKNLSNEIRSFKKKLNDFYEKLKNV